MFTANISEKRLKTMKNIYYSNFLRKTFTIERINNPEQNSPGMKIKKFDTYFNVNNHFEGSAPLTIGKIQEKIG